MRGLYAIVDVESLGRAELDPIRFAEAVLSARPAALQLRDKSSSHGGGGMLTLLRALVPLCRAHGVPLFANDRADLAAIAECDGVHVGQSDLPTALARAIVARAGKGQVGVSTHNELELARAIAERPGYIALGPVFPTASKVNPDPTIGLERLARMAAEVRDAGLPVVAIGGIDSTRIAQMSAHCDAAAVIGALLPASDVGDRYQDVAQRARDLERRFLAGAP
jgi:thiamine-phosphate pyrophosphorylase